MCGGCHFLQQTTRFRVRVSFFTQRKKEGKKKKKKNECVASASAPFSQTYTMKSKQFFPPEVGYLDSMICFDG
jgi:hypothetical protein